MSQEQGPESEDKIRGTEPPAELHPGMRFRTGRGQRVFIKYETSDIWRLYECASGKFLGTVTDELLRKSFRWIPPPEPPAGARFRLRQVEWEVVGSTPSTVQLKLGEQQVSLSRDNFNLLFVSAAAAIGE